MRFNFCFPGLPLRAGTTQTPPYPLDRSGPIPPPSPRRSAPNGRGDMAAGRDGATGKTRETLKCIGGHLEWIAFPQWGQVLGSALRF